MQSYSHREEEEKNWKPQEAAVKSAVGDVAARPRSSSVVLLEFKKQVSEQCISGSMVSIYFH